MTKSPILLFISFFIPLIGFGQAQSSSYFVNDLNMKSSKTEIEVTAQGDTIMVAYFEGNDFVNQSTRGTMKKYIGTPYYRNQWFPGTASLKGEDQSQGLLAFDMVNNTLHFALDDKSPALQIEPYTFEIDGLVFKKLEKEVRNAGSSYYNLLSTTEPILVKQHTGRYYPLRGKSETAYENTKSKEYEGKFTKSHRYYFVVGAELIPISRKKSFYTALGSEANKVKKVIQANKLNLKKEQDILKLGNLLDE